MSLAPPTCSSSIEARRRCAGSHRRPSAGPTKSTRPRSRPMAASSSSMRARWTRHPMSGPRLPGVAGHDHDVEDLGEGYGATTSGDGRVVAFVTSPPLAGPSLSGWSSPQGVRHVGKPDRPARRSGDVLRRSSRPMASGSRTSSRPGRCERGAPVGTRAGVRRARRRWASATWSASRIARRKATASASARDRRDGQLASCSSPRRRTWRCGSRARQPATQTSTCWATSSCGTGPPASVTRVNTVTSRTPVARGRSLSDHQRRWHAHRVPVAATGEPRRRS